MPDRTKLLDDFDKASRNAIFADQHLFNVGEGVKSTVGYLEGKLPTEEMTELMDSWRKERQVSAWCRLDAQEG